MGPFNDNIFTRSLAIIIVISVLALMVDRYLVFAKGAPRPVVNMVHDNMLFHVPAERLIDRSQLLGQCYRFWSDADYPSYLTRDSATSYAEQAKLEKKRDRWMLRRLETMRGLASAHDTIRDHLKYRLKGETGSAAAEAAHSTFVANRRVNPGPFRNGGSVVTTRGVFQSCSKVGRSWDFWEYFES